MSSINVELSALQYSTNASGAWVTEIVDSAAGLRMGTSIALDALGNVHISYSGHDGTPKYATNASGAWVTEIVDSAGYVGQYTSIVLDGAGHAHISYYDATNYALKYATNASGAWVAENACNRLLGCGKYSSLALSPDGAAYISHYGADGTLRFTSEAPTPVDLVSFDALKFPGGVRIEWETASETDNDGFNLWRSEAEDQGYETINEALIPAEGPAGAAYAYLDREVLTGMRYYYKLEAVDTHGESRFFGPISFVMSQGWGPAVAQAASLTGVHAKGSTPVNGLMAIAPSFLTLWGWMVYRKKRNKRGKPDS